MTAHLPFLRLSALVLLASPPVALAAPSLPAAAWPGQRAALPAAAVPTVIFAQARPVAVATGPGPAAIVEAVRALPLTGRLAGSALAPGTVAIGPFLLRPGDRLPGSLLPSGFPPIHLVTVAAAHWTILVEPPSQPAWTQDLPLTQLLP